MEFGVATSGGSWKLAQHAGEAGSAIEGMRKDWIDANRPTADLPVTGLACGRRAIADRARIEQAFNR